MKKNRDIPPTSFIEELNKSKIIPYKFPKPNFSQYVKFSNSIFQET